MSTIHRLKPKGFPSSKIMQYTKCFEYIRENNDYEDESDNFKTLNASGFWGKAVGNKIMAAGCIFIALSTGRILLGHRSGAVLEPNTWGGFGGASSKDDNGELEVPVETVRREAGEEVGQSNVNKVIKFVPSYVYKANTSNGKTFEYHNFLAFVKDEFVPSLNWENSEADWFEYGDWPSPLHFGFADLIDQAGIKIQKLITNITSHKSLNEGKFTSRQLDLVKVYDIFKDSYEKATGQTWTFEKFVGRARNWTFYGDEKGFVTVRFQRSNRVKLVGVAGNTKSILRGFREMNTDNANKPIWGAVSADIANMIVRIDPSYRVLKLPGGMIGSVLFNAIKAVIPTMSMGGAEIVGSKPDGSITFKYPDVGETDKVLVGNQEYFDTLKTQILLLPTISIFVKNQIKKLF